jgi:hypothetical protein
MSDGGDELLLDAGSMMEPKSRLQPAANGTRSWLERARAGSRRRSRAAREGGTCSSV